MRIIGVTGGIGAGKSAVLSYLEKRYVARVVQADKVAHALMEPGQAVYGKVIEAFGEKILAADGRIDRRVLGGLVFSDEEERRRLNAIVHPAVKEELLSCLERFREEGAGCAVVEAALFLEENYGAFCHETWYIYTDEKRRRARLKESRAYTEEQMDRIFASQRAHEEFLSRCDTVIDNNGTAEKTCLQIDGRMEQTG